MKNKVKIIIAAIILLVLFLPVPTGVYKDGGTRTYTALTYKIVDWNRLCNEGEIYTKTRIYPFPLNFKSLDSLFYREEKRLASAEKSGLEIVKGINVDTFGRNTQYIRTDGYHENVSYPKAVIIRSVNEFKEYYEKNKELYNLERRTDIASDSTIGFLDACDRYDDEYFKGKILVLVLLEEGSGSNRHEVTGVCLDNKGKLQIKIETKVPEVGTCDMAEWHLFIEPADGVNVTDESNVIIELNGKQYSHNHATFTETDTVDEVSGGYCGNTQTTVYFKDLKKYSFMYGKSVDLTHILYTLDYTPAELCNCLPEYTVDTEFGTGYEINLTKGFVRCDKGQASITEERAEEIKSIILWAYENAE